MAPDMVFELQCLYQFFHVTFVFLRKQFPHLHEQSIMTEIQFDDGYIFCVKCSLQRLSTLLGELFQEVLETLGSATLLEITKRRFWGVGVG